MYYIKKDFSLLLNYSEKSNKMQLHLSDVRKVVRQKRKVLLNLFNGVTIIHNKTGKVYMKKLWQKELRKLRRKQEFR